MIWWVVVPAAVASGWLLGHGNAEANLRAALSLGSAGALWMTLGFAAGLYGRDRIRLRRTYASPALAFLGKRLLLAALTAAAMFAFSPVDWPAACLEPLSVGAALGTAVWVGNLPTRL